MKVGSGGKQTVDHQYPMPENMPAPPDGRSNDDVSVSWWEKNHGGDERPFESVRCPVKGGTSPHEKRLRQWIRARGRISECPPNVREEEMLVQERLGRKGDNHHAHTSALAYMSDSYFIGGVSRAHNLTRFSNRRSIDKMVELFKGSEVEKDQMREYLEGIGREEAEEQKELGGEKDGRKIGMMVSLDHTIFFHNPRAFRADEWILTETETPWAGDGRGLVQQRMWTKEGVLIATCTQEGLVRLAQDKDSRL